MSWSRRGRRSSTSSCSIRTIRARSAFQLDRIETHLAALPRRNAAGRLSPVQQIAAVDRDAAAHRRGRRGRRGADRRDRTIPDEALRRHRAAYLTNNERSGIGVGGAGVIYDVRQTTTCGYASPVAHAHHVLRLTPIIARRPARSRRRAADRAGAGAPARGPGFFRQSPDLGRHRGAARDADDQIGGAGRRRSRWSSPTPAATPPWEAVREAAFADQRYRPAVAGAFSVPEPHGVARSGNPRLRPRELSAPAGRCSTPRSS